MPKPDGPEVLHTGVELCPGCGEDASGCHGLAAHGDVCCGCYTAVRYGVMSPCEACEAREEEP